MANTDARIAYRTGRTNTATRARRTEDLPVADRHVATHIGSLAVDAACVDTRTEPIATRAACPAVSSFGPRRGARRDQHEGPRAKRASSAAGGHQRAPAPAGVRCSLSGHLQAANAVPAAEADTRCRVQRPNATVRP